jgi:hypothetical protein
MQHSNEGFQNENAYKVAYIIGLMDSKINFGTWDDIAIEIENIVSDWNNKIDIRNDGEEGYIMEYATRFLQEKYIK